MISYKIISSESLQSINQSINLLCVIKLGWEINRYKFEWACVTTCWTLGEITMPVRYTTTASFNFFRVLVKKKCIILQFFPNVFFMFQPQSVTLKKRCILKMFGNRCWGEDLNIKCANICKVVWSWWDT